MESEKEDEIIQLLKDIKQMLWYYLYEPLYQEEDIEAEEEKPKEEKHSFIPDSEIDSMHKGYFG